VVAVAWRSRRRWAEESGLGSGQEEGPAGSRYSWNGCRVNTRPGLRLVIVPTSDRKPNAGGAERQGAAAGKEDRRKQTKNLKIREEEFPVRVVED